MRADKYFSARFGSRTKAKEALEAGRVLRGDKVLSPSDEVGDGELFTVLEDDDFVSNGGRKLERALSVFGESVEGKRIADLGASTGGFTDCLLRRGASRVYCVDVGESLLAPAVASDPRVYILDKTNARTLTPAHFPYGLDDVVSDLSFISLRLVLPAVEKILPPEGRAFVLFKPQFECGKNVLGKSGILPQNRHAALISGFYDFCTGLGLAPCGIVNAPLFPKKNIEYMILLRKGGVPLPKEDLLMRAKKIF